MGIHVQSEVLRAEAPHALVYTWVADWDPGATTTVQFRLDATDAGTRVTLRHTGFSGRPESCQGHGDGWEHVLAWLDAYLVPPRPLFLCRLIPPRPTFIADMDDAERAIMVEHAGYWHGHLAARNAVAFGPVADPAGGWGLGILHAEDEVAVRAIEAADPAIRSGRGFRYEILPLPMGLAL